MTIGSLKCLICNSPITTHHGHYRAKRRGYGFCSSKCNGAHLQSVLSQDDDIFLRVLRNVDRSGDGCWPYKGRTSNGYGVIDWQQRPHLAHRLMFALINNGGDVPPQDMCVCHSCDNPLCCNPAHLWLGTHSDNMRDMYAKGRKIKHGARGERVNTSKLTETQVRTIRTSCELDNVLALQYGVSPVQIRNVRHGRHWKHVK